MRRSTHSIATLQVSEECYNEIAARLAATGYQSVFLKTVSGIMIDMTGIALISEEQQANPILPIVEEKTNCQCGKPGIAVIDGEYYCSKCVPIPHHEVDWPEI